MKIVIFGGTGGVGKELTDILHNNHEIISLGSSDVDITNLSEVKTFFAETDVDAVINLCVKNLCQLLLILLILINLKVQIPH